MLRKRNHNDQPEGAITNYTGEQKDQDRSSLDIENAGNASDIPTATRDDAGNSRRKRYNILCLCCKRRQGFDHHEEMDEATDSHTMSPTKDAMSLNQAATEIATIFRRKRLFRLAFAANLCFLVGSLLQGFVAYDYLEWTRAVQGYPVHVLLADDDATWQAYQRTQRYHGDNSATRNDARLLAERSENKYRYLSLGGLQSDIWLALSALGHDEPTGSGNELSRKKSRVAFEELDAAAILWRHQQQQVTNTPTPILRQPTGGENSAMILTTDRRTTKPTLLHPKRALQTITNNLSSVDQASMPSKYEQLESNRRHMSISSTSTTKVQADTVVSTAPEPALSSVLNRDDNESSGLLSEKEVTQTSQNSQPKYASKQEHFGDDSIATFADVDIGIEHIFSIGSSLFFLIMGIVNWIREEQVFHIWMVQGSICMMLSVLALVHSQLASLVFRNLGLHCYFVESAYMLRLRKSIRALDGLETLSMTLWIADGLFGSGTIIGVILSYWQFFDRGAQFDLNMGYGKVLSAFLWLIAAALYVLATIILSAKDIDRYRERSRRMAPFQLEDGSAP